MAAVGLESLHGPQLKAYSLTWLRGVGSCPSKEEPFGQCSGHFRNLEKASELSGCRTRGAGDEKKP